MKVPKGVDLEARFIIAAETLYSHFKYGQSPHSRIFQMIIYDEWIEIGESMKGATHKEHVVPLIYLLNWGKKLFNETVDVKEYAEILKECLKIVRISKEEMDLLDKIDPVLKTGMPEGWKRGDSIFARLDCKKIKWAPYNKSAQ